MIFKKNATSNLLSVSKIWDIASHSGMTDLIRFKNRWYCAFREGSKHVGGKNGIIRLLSSPDGIVWQNVTTFVEEGIDLRDPKLSITPTGQLMLLVGGTTLDENDKYLSLQCRVAFSFEGTLWTPFQLILTPHEWMWRITWHQGKAYGASYSRSDPLDKSKEWNIKLFESDDGVHWTLITHWDIQGYPNETTIRFFKFGQMVALVRREKKGKNHAWLGTSDPPFQEWHWSELNIHLGGPNFLILPDDTMWAAGRLVQNTPYGEIEKTFVGPMDFHEIHRQLVLPSGGDCGYPGMVFHDGILWISYYSSHENNTAIYLARVSI